MAGPGAQGMKRRDFLKSMTARQAPARRRHRQSVAGWLERMRSDTSIQLRCAAFSASSQPVEGG
jgi:hypothetical protein